MEEVVHYQKKSIYDLFSNDNLFEQSKDEIHMKETKIYQITVVGQYKHFGNECKISSKDVYTHYPSEEEIKKFIDKCSNSNPDDPMSFFDLNPNKEYKVKIIELILHDNKNE